MSDEAIPEDIPVDVWKYAESVEKVWRDLPPRKAVEHHARLILAERAAERERCAVIADEHGLLDGGPCLGCGEQIAASIRSSHE